MKINDYAEQDLTTMHNSSMKGPSHNYAENSVNSIHMGGMLQNSLMVDPTISAAM